MSTVHATILYDRSVTATGGSDALFPAAPDRSIHERYVANPHATNTIWIHPLGGVAAANALGCIPIGPLQVFTGQWVNATNVFAPVGTPVTAGER